MECRNINEKHGALLTVAASLILLAAIVLSIGTAYGRYETVLNGVGNIAVLSKAKASVAVTKSSSSEWIVADNSANIKFSVSNLDANGSTAERDFAVRVRLFVPKATASQEGIRVILKLDGRSYEATAVSLGTGTQIYEEAGAGSVYCFMENDGSELNWPFSAGDAETLEMELTALNVSDVSGFRLYTETVKVP